MKLALRRLAALAFLVAVVGIAFKSTALYGPAAGLGLAAMAFWIGANMLDTNWSPRARLCTNDISMAGLTELLYLSRDQVAAEPTGLIQGVIVNGGSERVSAGGTVTSLRTSQPTLLTSYTPAMTVPDAADITTDVETMSLDKIAGSQIALKGETVMQLAATVGYEDALRQTFSQALRVIRNQIEADLGTALKNGASRATGTAGTTPFASNFNTIADLRQILEDNGCPMTDAMLSLVISSSAGTNLRNLSTLYKANEAGSDVMLRRGELLNLHNFSIRTSAGIASHTKGAGTGYLINNGSNEAVGQVTLTLDTGTVNTTGFKAGDIITHASDSTNKYVVKTGLTATAGDIVIAQPGLRIAALNNDAVTIGNSYTGNVGFHKTAAELAMRPIALPAGGDAGQHQVLYDPVTGLTFDVGIYKGRGMNIIEIFTRYGVKVWKPEFVATLLG